MLFIKTKLCCLWKRKNMKRIPVKEYSFVSCGNYLHSGRYPLLFSVRFTNKLVIEKIKVINKIKNALKVHSTFLHFLPKRKTVSYPG